MIGKIMLEELKKLFDKKVKQSQDMIEKFENTVKNNGYHYALDNSDHIYYAAANELLCKYYFNYLNKIENPDDFDFDKFKNNIKRAIINDARFVKRSTSVTSNLLDAFAKQALAEISNELEYL
jgi:hypothetical protein